MMHDDWLALFTMGDYGVYVWSSFLAFIVIFIGLWLISYNELKNHGHDET